VAGDLQRKGYLGKTIGIKLRFDDFKGVTRDQTLDHYIGDAAAIRAAAGQALKRAPLTQRLRLLGVRVGALIRTEDAPVQPGNKPILQPAQETLLFPED
jgi:DNA polymerase-4